MARKRGVLRAIREAFERVSSQPGFDPDDDVGVIMAVRVDVDAQIENGQVREFPWILLFELLVEFVLRLLELFRNRRDRQRPA